MDTREKLINSGDYKMSILLRTSVKQQVYEIIKEKILSQEYKLGEKINILNLCKELNVSNTPVREALSMLEKDGLVIMQQNSGPKVIEMTKENFSEISETVLTLILGGYELCRAKDLKVELTEIMKASLEDQKKVEFNGSDYEFAEKAISFDACLIQIVDNNRLKLLFDRVFNIFLLVVLYEHQKKGVDRTRSIGEHQAIVDAIESGDDEKVREAIKIHYARV